MVLHYTLQSAERQKITTDYVTDFQAITFFEPYFDRTVKYRSYAFSYWTDYILHLTLMGGEIA